MEGFDLRSACSWVALYFLVAAVWAVVLRQTVLEDVDETFVALAGLFWVATVPLAALLLACYLAFWAVAGPIVLLLRYLDDRCRDDNTYHW